LPAKRVSLRGQSIVPIKTDYEIMAAIDPLPENPTNSDLANGITQLHNCLEDLRLKNNKRLFAIERQMKTQSALTKDIRSNQKLIAQAFSITDKDGDVIKSRDKTVAMMTQREVIIKIVIATGSSLSAVFIIWKIIWTVYPFVWHALQALNHVVTR
jgi:hypothetical protein